MTNPRIRFSLQVGPVDDGRELRELATTAEGLGFDALFAPDHPGTSASPFVTLAQAAAVTTTLRLGTNVLNTGVREPLDIACEVATLDALSGGRMILGVGAGHTPAEWTMTGRVQPSPAQRIERLGEFVVAVRALLVGDVVVHRGKHLQLVDAHLAAPRPIQRPVPLLIGGNGTRLLQLAGSVADVVGLSGLARTLEDGHRHEVAWDLDSIDERVAIIREAARGRSTPPRLDALVQHIEITSEHDAAAARVASAVEGATPTDVSQCPYVLVGSVSELVDEILGHQERWGIDSYVVRAPGLRAASELIAPLS